MSDRTIGRHTILVGDVRERLRDLPGNSVHCVVTSPPYYGLRDYGVAGQIGLEPTLAEYIAGMVAVFREVRRVLRPDGTCWLNIGDSYTSGNSGQRVRDSNCGFQPDITTMSQANTKANPGRPPEKGWKTKDLMMVPARLAIALQDDGWWLRSDIIWHKKAPMPESVTDRPTSAHEHIFLLAKNARYYYDADAVREDCISTTPEGNKVDMNGGRLTPGGWSLDPAKSIPEGGRNLRNVWTLGPEPFPDAHFATYPTEIPRRAIKAGCPVDGTVLDPFLGSGTTMLVADQLGRTCIGVELNPEYAAMAERRVWNDAPLLVGVA